MEIGAASIIPAIGILLGINYVGLFVAAYVFDRSARHLLYYLAAIAAFVLNGICYFLSQVAVAYSDVLHILVEMLQGLGLIGFAYGFAAALRIAISERFLWSMFATGTAFAAGLHPFGEIHLARLVPMSIWHATITGYLVYLLYQAPDAGLKHRLLALLMAGVCLAAIIPSIVAGYFAWDGGISPARQNDIYTAIVATSYLSALFALAAGVFFHVMSDLVMEQRKASVTDSLTGLLNRRGFLDAVAERLVQPSSLIMIDIDAFKSVNDTYGHDVGDQVIVALARILRCQVDPAHVSGRLGGEEFAVLLRRTELKTAGAIAQALRVAAEVELGAVVDHDRTITASLGVAAIGERGIGGALVDADHALYRAKRGGRNRVCVTDGAGPRQGARARSARVRRQVGARSVST